VPPCFALRELLVQAELGGTGQWAEGCVVAARTHLPPGVYVDPYELASLQQHNVTKVRRQELSHLGASHIKAEPVFCWQLKNALLRSCNLCPSGGCVS